jgi:hypothetical protein
MEIDLNNRKELEKTINYGYSIVSELFKLSDKKLKVKIKGIIEKKYHEIIDNTPTIRRIIENEKPTKIEIFFWDSLTIEWYGIDYKAEHGIPKRIREFDKHFTL